jgi:hypothetical protein
MYSLVPKQKLKLIHGDMNENSRLWVYLKDGIRYQFLFGILGIPEGWYMLLDFSKFWVHLNDGVCYWMESNKTRMKNMHI